MAKRKAAEEHVNHERWLITYADLITLLMVFFVVMYSMSKVDANKFQAMADALSISLGGGSAQINIAQHPQGPSFVEEGGAEKSQEQTNLENLKAKLDAYAQDNAINTQLVADIEERGLVISIQETLLFESGSDVLNTQAHAILSQISTVLATMPNYIRVEGHTDNMPISSGRFPSNWELSVMRASNVIHILNTEGVGVERLSAVGYSEFRPLYANNSPEGRARNRRVDLVILRSAYNPVEPGAQSD
ncbi:MAG: OmpA family protein [Peptococcaceae bacterium]|nr:OmpA family protein [Peptococcaceae bacterium]